MALGSGGCRGRNLNTYCPRSTGSATAFGLCTPISANSLEREHTAEIAAAEGIHYGQPLPCGPADTTRCLLRRCRPSDQQGGYPSVYEIAFAVTWAAPVPMPVPMADMRPDATPGRQTRLCVSCRRFAQRFARRLADVPEAHPLGREQPHPLACFFHSRPRWR